MVGSVQHPGLVMNRALDIVDSIKRKLGGLAADEGDVSAVEFAMLLLLVLSLYLGSVEVSQGIGADRKVTLTARTICDLVSRVSDTVAAGHVERIRVSAAPSST